MKSRSIRLELESLEDRCVPSTVPYDFNGDGREDIVAITSPTKITVSLANLDGGYTVSAILTAPKNLPITSFHVADYNGDGNLDISSFAYTDGGSRFYRHTWLGNDDGTFDARDTLKGRVNPGW